MSTIKLGANKLAHLEPRLEYAMRSAISTYPGPAIAVVDVLRTPERQRELVKSGASRTMSSKHLAQADGYSHAIDIAFSVGKEVRFDWPLYYELASHVRYAARLTGTPITWGAIWDTKLNDVDGDLVKAHAAYVARFLKARGRRPLADGPHFQLG